MSNAGVNPRVVAPVLAAGAVVAAITSGLNPVNTVLRWTERGLVAVGLTTDAQQAWGLWGIMTALLAPQMFDLQLPRLIAI